MGAPQESAVLAGRSLHYNAYIHQINNPAHSLVTGGIKSPSWGPGRDGWGWGVGMRHWLLPLDRPSFYRRTFWRPWSLLGDLAGGWASWEPQGVRSGSKT